MNIMDESPELVFKKICCTCLSVNRKLFLLHRVHDGINNLYLLLSSDTEAYAEGFYKDAATLSICFECKAIMRRISQFRRQACIAQKKLTAIMEGWADADSTKSLSSLMPQYITTVEEVTSLDTVTSTRDIDTFVDCGKTELDIDDVPLSNFYRYYACSIDEEELPPNGVKHHMKDVKKKKIKTRKVKKKMDDKYFTITKPSEEDSTDYKSKCEFCLKGYNDLTEFEKHNCVYQIKTTQVGSDMKPVQDKILTEKKTLNEFKCPQCDKYFDNKNIRYKHIKKQHSEGYSCSVCGKRFPFKDSLLKHERLHQGPLPREECPTCHKMIRVDLVRAHAKIHSPRETVTCVECNKVYTSRASYENHLKYNQAHASDVRKFKCSMCDKGYRSKGELRDHVNYQHLGKTQHKCPVCGKAIATRRCITRHIRRAHQNIKENPRDKICQQCGKAFQCKKSLREHEFIHTGERPLSCEICGCTFRQSASLYTHKKRVHKIHPQKKSVELIEPS